MSQLRTLQIFSNAFEAEILRTRLDAEGIYCVVNGSEVATMLSHFGAAAARVRVEVAAEDFQFAQQILDADEIDRIECTAWRCARCDERNEPLFDLCWNCSKQRDELDAEEPNVETEFASAPPFSLTSDSVPPSLAPININPYAAPPIRRGSEFDSASDEPNEFEFNYRDARLVDRVTRIFRGSVIGMVFAPPLLSTYVLLQLITQVPLHAYRDPRLRWPLMTAWILCLCSFLLALVIWAMLF